MDNKQSQEQVKENNEDRGIIYKQETRSFEEVREDFKNKCALPLQNHFNNKWFNVKQVTKKFNLKTEQESTTLLNQLVGLNLAVSKLGGIKNNHSVIYKIVITTKDQIEILQSRKQELLKEVDRLNKEIDRLGEE